MSKKQTTEIPVSLRPILIQARDEIEQAISAWRLDQALVALNKAETLIKEAKEKLDG